uniref:Uncharacterized protein n=1 Tax=Arundo donax TaxID=35708 RepID=A0A0A9F8R5_ARUDO
MSCIFWLPLIWILECSLRSQFSLLRDKSS